MSNRSTISVVTRRTHRAARGSMTWQQARASALEWCLNMWPDFALTKAQAETVKGIKARRDVMRTTRRELDRGW